MDISDCTSEIVANEEISKPILNSNNINKSVSDEAANKQLKSEIISKNFDLVKSCTTVIKNF